MHTPLRYRDAYAFFLPLIFMAELMVLSHSIIHAFLARQPDPAVALAAFSTAFAFHTTLGSPIWTLPMIGLSFINSRQSVRQLVKFISPLVVASLVVDLLVAFTPLGDGLFGGVFGASEAVVAQARYAVLLMFPVMPLVVVRAIAMALLMLERRTYLITLGTFIRLGALAFFLSVTAGILPGAMHGAVGHSFGIAVETTLMAALAWRAGRRLPAQEEHQPTLGAMWRFSLPLMVNYVAESGVAVMINFFLGRLAAADLALATFGVANGLVNLLMSPLRNLTQTMQTLGKQVADHGRMVRFSGQVIGLFTVLLIALFFTPLREWVLRDVMGLNDRLSQPVGVAVRFALLTGVCWGFAATVRGLLAVLRHTRPMSYSAVGRLAVVGVVGSSVFLFPQANGGVVGIIAITGAALAEVTILTWAYIRLAPGK